MQSTASVQEGGREEEEGIMDGSMLSHSTVPRGELLAGARGELGGEGGGGGGGGRGGGGGGGGDIPLHLDARVPPILVNALEQWRPVCNDLPDLAT